MLLFIFKRLGNLQNGQLKQFLEEDQLQEISHNYTLSPCMLHLREGLNEIGINQVRNLMLNPQSTAVSSSSLHVASFAFLKQKYSNDQWRIALN